MRTRIRMEFTRSSRGDRCSGGGGLTPSGLRECSHSLSQGGLGGGPQVSASNEEPPAVPEVGATGSRDQQEER
jgi:hypothetical protein